MVINVEKGRTDEETALNFVNKVLSSSSGNSSLVFMIPGVGPVQVSVRYNKNPTADLICMIDPLRLKTEYEINIFTEDILSRLGVATEDLRLWRKDWKDFLAKGGTYQDRGFHMGDSSQE